MEGFAHCVTQMAYTDYGNPSNLFLALGNFYTQEGLDTSRSGWAYNFEPLQPNAEQIAKKIKAAQENAHKKYLENNKKLGWCKV